MAEVLHKNALAYHDKEVSKLYVEGRPTYPNEALELLKELVPIDAKIVDLAAGTGKFTLMLKNAGFKNITAVEPSPDFREQCKNVLSLGDEDKGISVIEGYSTKLQFEDNSIDCLVIAQAFHWFADIPSIIEISRVLKPNGLFFLIWNQLNETGPLFQDMISLMKSDKFRDDDSPKSQTNKWKNVFNELKELPIEQSKSLINPDLTCKSFDNPQITNCEKLISTVLSISFISLLPQDRKDQLVEAIRLTTSKNELSSNNKDFSVNYRTDCYYTTKKQ